MPIGFTERGFADYADFKDTYDTHVRVRESSSAMQDCVWIFLSEGLQARMPRASEPLDPSHPDVYTWTKTDGSKELLPDSRFLYVDQEHNPVALRRSQADNRCDLKPLHGEQAAHLNLEQAKLLRDALSEWISTHDVE